jgi:N-acetylneuraminic acid mutarotase
LARGPTQETATVAVDGKIYVLGGFDENLGVLATVQVFDVAACTWSMGPPLPRAVHHANAAVVDGTIWILGAMESLSFTPRGYVWSWTPAIDAAWTEHPAMPAGLERGAAVTGVIGGRVYLAGGLRSGAVAQLHGFDPQTGTWDTTLPPLPTPIDHGCGGVVGGSLYVIGGRSGQIGAISGAVHAYTPGGSWDARAALPTPRGGTACGVVGDRIVVVGGEGNTGVASGVFPDVEAYTPALNSWAALAPMPVPRHGMGAAAWAGSLYVPGGATTQGFGAVATHEVLTP